MKQLSGFLLFAGVLAAQYAPVPGTAYPALEAILNAKPAMRFGVGVPVASCTQAYDLYLNSSNGDLYVCSATNVWLKVTGAAGGAGTIGAAGPAGATGATGVAGAVGPTGATGIAGGAGPTGPAGVAGTAGPVGATGVAGPAGAPGTAGVTGATGAAGIAGATGPSGAAGPTLTVFGRLGTVVAVSGDYSAAQVTNAVDKTAANSYTAGAKQGFQSSATTAAMNFGGVSADPSGLSEGDVWYRTDTHALRQYQNSLAVTIGGGSATANRSEPFSFSGGGTAMVGSSAVCKSLGYAATITGVTLIPNPGDGAGGITIDLKTALESTGAGWQAALASITASAIPAISAGVFYNDTTLTGWSKTVAKDTIVCAYMSSPSVFTGATLILKLAASN